ncbi:Trm112 family protein [Acidimangrovimonas sediminis]|uniref:Trm112 family protein n=1 Tax=Acidimangrovimonas sediminis TaxID=2056283 RepID=UPI000C7FCE15|nr:Trm112 family protein [Acidimangrovimonas sediminis]
MTDTPASAPATGTAEAGERRPAFDRHMLEALVCPLTLGPLSYDAEAQELISKSAHLAFPIRDGIPVMLASEARRTDD